MSFSHELPVGPRLSWRIPSLTALRTLEAAARHLSFTKAAIELHLTPSAVSRQVRDLEAELGVTFFERVRQRLVLTEVGRAYVAEVVGSLERLQSATLELLAHRGQGGVLRLATQPAIGMKWLIPRLGRFTTKHPEILLHLATRSRTPFDFGSEPLDAAIHYGQADWPGVVMDRLGDGQEIVVCSPAYLRTMKRLKEPEDLARAVLLQHARRPEAWRRWFEAAGAPAVDARSGPRYEHYYMIGQAALAGSGMALLPRLLVQDDLAAGRLVQPFGVRYLADDAYYLVYPESRRFDARVALFRDWATAEARRGRVPRAAKAARPC